LQNANGALSRSANQMRVLLALGQSGVSNFALVGKKIKKKCPLSQPISISNFALYVIKLIISGAAPHYIVFRSYCVSFPFGLPPFLFKYNFVNN